MLMVHPLNNELVMLFQSKPSELFDVNSILKSYIGRRTVCFSTSGFREREMFLSRHDVVLDVDDAVRQAVQRELVRAD